MRHARSRWMTQNKRLESKIYFHRIAVVWVQSLSPNTLLNTVALFIKAILITPGCCSQGSPSTWTGRFAFKRTYKRINQAFVIILQNTHTSMTFAWPSDFGADNPTCSCAMWNEEYRPNTSRMPSLYNWKRLFLPERPAITYNVQVNTIQQQNPTPKVNSGRPRRNIRYNYRLQFGKLDASTVQVQIQPFLQILAVCRYNLLRAETHIQHLK